MEHILYNAIKTPDGTVLWCQSGHDYQSHKDKVSGETYMNDGTGISWRRSVNIVAYEDLSISTADSFDKVRTAKFWGSYGKDGKSPKVMLALEEMEDTHLQAILKTQKLPDKIKEIFIKEVNYRTELFKEHLSSEVDEKKADKKKKKI